MMRLYKPLPGAATLPPRFRKDAAMSLNTVDPAEVAKFQAMAAEWWDPNGKFRPLHMMNPVRLDYITRQIAAEFGRDLAAPRPFAGLRLLDIGCGGGLLSEPMARLGAEVVGADAAEGNILDIDPHSFGGIGVFAIPNFARFYRHVLIGRHFPHHGAVAFSKCGKVLFDAVKLMGVDDISVPLPKTMLYPGENPFEVL